MITRREALEVVALAGLRCMLGTSALANSARAVDKPDKSGVPPPYRVVHGWPDLPEGYFLGQVSGVAVDSGERVFVFHRGDPAARKPTEPIPAPAVLCIDGHTGKLLDSWGANHFLFPHGMRVDGDDHLWLTDCSFHQVFKYTREGKLLMAVGTERTPGCDATHFNRPTDVAVAADGTFYVSDGYGNSRVAKFAPDGTFLLDWGRAGNGPGEFHTPHNVLVGPDGRVYVADRANARLQVFTPDGQFVAQWKGSALGRPWGLANGPDGTIYVVDGGDHFDGPANRGRLMRVDLNGNVLEKWGAAGRYDGQLWLGHDIAVGRSGDVYVGDVNLGMRVQKFSRHAG